MTNYTVVGPEGGKAYVADEYQEKQIVLVDKPVNVSNIKVEAKDAGSYKGESDYCQVNSQYQPAGYKPVVVTVQYTLKEILYHSVDKKNY
ncbi:hypothetical protein GCM10027291_37730 [Telluribacter humicola]